MKTGFARTFGMALAIAALTGFAATLPAAAQETPPADASLTPDNGSNGSTLPPGVDPDSPLAHVIRLAQAGINESVILTYITNSASPFNLTADQIIYLRDVGLSDEVVTAMMQRDQVLATETGVTAAPQPVATSGAVETTETSPEVITQPPAEITVNYFYDTLAPYGTWVDVAGYGRCWRPSVVVYAPDWQPYCDHGHWIYTDCGWYWVSDYSWGWATFHYGRWFRDPRWGWCWYPGTVWGPAWVTWRYSDDYCGWAPLPPFATWTVGVGWTYRGAVVSAGFDFGLRPDCFTFVPARHFCDTRPWHYRVAGRDAAHIYDHTTIINNFSVNHATLVNHGIPPRHIADLTHRPIQTVTLRDADRRMARAEQFGRDGRTLFVNRPRVSEHPTPAPMDNHPLPGAAFQGPAPRRDFNPPPRSGVNAGNENQFSRRNPAAPGWRQQENNPPGRFPTGGEARPPVRAIPTSPAMGQPQSPPTPAPAPAPPRLGPAVNQPLPPPANRPLPGAAYQGPAPRTDFNPPNGGNDRPAWMRPPPPTRSPREAGSNPAWRAGGAELTAPARPAPPMAENRQLRPFERMDPAPTPQRNFEAPRPETPPPVQARPERPAPPVMSAPRAQPPPAPASPPAQAPRAGPNRDKNQNGW